MAEGRYGRTRESQVPGLLEAYQIPCTFSDSLSLAICLDKGRTKEILKLAQIPTPEYQVLAPETNIETAIAFPFFLKPLYEGTSKGINEKSVVYTQDEFVARIKWLWSEYSQPILLEKYLPGREFTVGILGTGKDARVLGMMEVLLNEGGEIYGFREKENYARLVSYKFNKKELKY